MCMWISSRIFIFMVGCVTGEHGECIRTMGETVNLWGKEAWISESTLLSND